GLRISKEERLNEEEETAKLYRDVNINQGRGIQETLDVEDSHVNLTSVHLDGQQESPSVSSHFVTSMLNPPSDAGMESIFATASSSIAPLQTYIPIMTPSTIATITTISHAPIPPTTIPSKVLQNLPTFDSVFRFEDKLKSLEASFSEYRQTNPFAEAVSNILDEGTGSKPGVPDVPTDESEEELLWNSSDDEGADDQEKVGDDDKDDEGNDSEEGEEDDDVDDDKNGDERDDDDDQDHEIAKHDDKDDTEESRDVNEEDESDKEDDNEETKDEESFDPIPQTPKSSEDEGDGEEDQGLRISKEERLNKEEEAEELYRDVNINQGRGIQATLDVEDSHVTLTLVYPNGHQESSSVSSHFVTSMLNPPSDAGMKSIFTTA
nr:hypothetical protein [Tanacetum cinerariifolium]